MIVKMDHEVGRWNSFFNASQGEIYESFKNLSYLKENFIVLVILHPANSKRSEIIRKIYKRENKKIFLEIKDDN